MKELRFVVKMEVLDHLTANEVRDYIRAAVSSHAKNLLPCDDLYPTKWNRDTLTVKGMNSDKR